MDSNKLNISFVENKAEALNTPPGKTSRRVELQAKMERLWLLEPQKFDTQRDCMQRHRVEVTLAALRSKLELKGQYVADLGTGDGVIARLISQEGATVDCVDVATNALLKLSNAQLKGIKTIHDCLPNTRLEDNAYDIVLCLDVIPYLHPNEYRVFMAEIARLVKPDGLVAISTGLDIDTEDPLEAFASLGETEFTIDTWVFSYHKLLIKLLKLFDLPQKIVIASKGPDRRQKELKKRSGLYKWLFKINSSFLLAPLWKIVSFISNPVASFLRQNNTLMHFFDKVSRMLWSEGGISDALFIGKRRPLNFDLPKNEIPKELKHKRQVWE